MTRNLKSLGLALVAVLALGAVAAQAASAHEFHQAEETAVITGEGVNPQTFKVGTAGTVTCNKATFAGTNKAAGSGSTWKSEKITVTPTYEECTFGGNPATVTTNHCAFVFEGTTTAGNPTENGEHANVEIECAENPETKKPTEIEIATSICTLTVGPQVIKHAVRYYNEETTPKTSTVEATAHKVKIGNTSDKPGCALVPKGEVAVYTGKTTVKCFKDEKEVTGTNLTTPGNFVKGGQIGCTVNGAPTGE